MGHERAIARRAIKFDLGLLQEIERAGKPMRMIRG
jgi:hypothetical protein